MPPKNSRKIKIKEEETYEYQFITEKVDFFSGATSSELIKDEKEEEVLVQESFRAQQVTFIENLCIKQEEPVEYVAEFEEDETETKFETVEDENYYFEDAGSISDENELTSESDTKKNLEFKKFKCKTCEETFATRTDLTHHRKIHTFPLKCTKCSKVFKIKKNFDSHKCTYECKICQKSFFRNDNLNQHMNYVHGNWKKCELFTCDCCGKGFKYKKSLACHMKQHMEVKPLICKVCNEGFSVKNTYTQHMLTHAGKVPCKICGKRLKPSAIYYHMRQAHETSKKFICTVCGAAFKTKGDLNSHFGTHDKKYQCSVCDKKFSRSYKLKLHFKIHENPRIFECKKCFKVLSRKDTLEMHEKWCGETFYCGNCDFATNFPKRLLTHEAKCIKKEKVKKFKSFKDFQDSSSDDQEDDTEVNEKRNENDLFCNHCNKLFESKEELSRHIMNIIM